VTTLLLDTHIVHWLSGDPGRLSRAAERAIDAADELAVAPPTWFELAWLHRSGRLEAAVPVRAWLEQLARGLRTTPLTPGIAARAAELPDTFPRDPADRVIFATSVELGLRLVTRDVRMRAADTGKRVVW
jgi:PIN domain nuclease of toxin-antitoxin system